MTGERSHLIDEDHMDLRELRAAVEGHGAAWSGLLPQDLDPDAIVVRRRDDGSETHAPLGIRLAQALHHGTDHRSQICTALTTLGVEPPAIDLWDFRTGWPRRRTPTPILTSWRLVVTGSGRRPADRHSTGGGRWPPGEQPTTGSGDDGEADEDEEEVEHRHLVHPLGELTPREGGQGEVAHGRTEQGTERTEGTGGSAVMLRRVRLLAPAAN